MNQKEDKPKKSTLKRILRFSVKSFLILFVLFIIIVLLIRSPWGQNLIIDRITNYVGDQIETPFSIDKFYITFNGNLSMEGLYLEDEAQDTLLYSKSLELYIPILPIVQENKILLKDLQWNGVVANIKRDDSTKDFNFQYIIDAFASSDEKDNKTANPYLFDVKHINLKDIQLNYDDEINAQQAEAKIGSLDLYFQVFDLENMRFNLKNWDVRKTDLSYIQLKKDNSIVDAQTSQNKSNSILPTIQLEELLFSQVNFYYEDENASTVYGANLKDFTLNDLAVNLNTNVYELEHFALQDAKIKINLPKTNEKEVNANETSSTIDWPQLDIKVNEFAVANNEFEYQIGNSSQVEAKAKKFSSEHILLTNFTANISSFDLSKQEKLSFQLNELSFKENSQLQVSDASFNFDVNEKQIQVSSLYIKTLKNELNANLDVEFNQLFKWIQNPKEFNHANFNLDANLKLAEFTPYLPQLDSIIQLKSIKNELIQLSVASNGNSEQINLNRFQLKVNSTKFNAKGKINNLSEFEKLSYNLSQIHFESTKNDIEKFTDFTTENFQLPNQIELDGNLVGNLKDVQSNTVILLPEGKVKFFVDVQQNPKIELKTNLELINLELGKILKQPKLEKVSWTLEADGEGEDWENLSASFTSSFKQLKYANIDLANLEFLGKLTNKVANFQFNLDQQNLQFNADSKIDLNDELTQANFNFNLKGINFKNLGFTAQDIRAKSKISAQFVGDENQFDISTKIDSTLVVYDQQKYQINPLEVKFKTDQQLTNFEATSSFLNSSFTANVQPAEVVNALKNHFQYYLNKNNKLQTNQENEKQLDEPAVTMQAKLDFYSSPLIDEIIVPNLKKTDTLSFDFIYQEQNHFLEADLKLPKLVYADTRLDSLQVNLITNAEKADFSFSFKNLASGIINLAETELSGILKEKQLQLNFEALQEGVSFFNIQTTTLFTEDGFEFSIQPDDLVLNSVAWNIPETNSIIYSNTKSDQLSVTDFKISHDEQRFEMKNNFDIDKPHVGLNFTNFKLSTLTNYLNPENQFATGLMSGNLVAINPFTKLGFISDFKIQQLHLLENNLGNLNFDAKAELNETYQLNLGLLGDQIDFAASGEINQTKEEPTFFVEAKLKKLNLPLLEKFTADYVSGADGLLTANFKLNRNQAETQYQGNLSFQNASFKLNDFKTFISLNDEQIDFDMDAIRFSNFEIQDQHKNSILVDGAVFTEKLLTPRFDLKFKASNFEALNTTKKDNKLYFGKLNFGADLQLSGNLDFPKIEGVLEINESSDLTYINPQSQAAEVERDGVVVFVNKNNPDDILTQPKTEDYKTETAGIEVDALLKINPNTKVKVIINPKNGDYVSLQGGGDLQYKMAKNGNINLQGQYEVKNGKLELNFYNLVKREFQIAKGSTVNWTGDPTNADIDIRAVYNIETSASSLMATQTSAEPSTVQNQYRQQFPFKVYLDVNGEINSPELNFKLDMPEEDRAAINGTVYSRIQQVNQQKDILNNHVFSLLVLNRFYPNSGSDGSQGGAASIARNNINQALSDQLNSYANKLTGSTGIQLNFDVNSYTNYANNQSSVRTDVDVSAQKTLFDERLILEAGSQVNVEGDLRPGETNAAIGNVSVQYLLTKDGRWKIKGFRKSEYENVIDGQVFVSGISLIFTKEFNRFKELWEQLFKAQLNENADANANEKQN